MGSSPGSYGAQPGRYSAAGEQHRALGRVRTIELPWPGDSRAAAGQFGKHFAWYLDDRFIALGRVVRDSIVAIPGAVYPSARLFSA